MRRQESDGDGGAGEKKERKTKTGGGWIASGRLVGERISRGGRTRPGEMEASHKTQRPHIKVRQNAEEEGQVAGGELSLPQRSHNQVGASRRRRRILALPWGNVGQY